MNKRSEALKPKGISVEGFWRQLKDKTANTDSGPNGIKSRDASEANIEFREIPDSKENWESRFDAWLDRL